TEVQALEADRRRAEERRAAAAAFAVALEAVEVPDGLDDVAGRAAAGRAALEQAEAQRARVEEALTAAQAAVDAADRAVADAGNRAALEALLKQHEQAAAL